MSDSPHAEEPRWLTPEEREAWLFISSIIFNLTRRLENQLQREADLSYVEYMVLAMLSESPELSLTMTELALTTNTLPARLSRVVARLEKDSLVERSMQGLKGFSRWLPAMWLKFADKSLTISMNSRCTTSPILAPAYWETLLRSLYQSIVFAAARTQSRPVLRRTGSPRSSRTLNIGCARLAHTAGGPNSRSRLACSAYTHTEPAHTMDWSG